MRNYWKLWSVWDVWTHYSGEIQAFKVLIIKLNMLDLLASQVDSQQQWCFSQFLSLLQIKEAESLGRIQAILATVDSLPDEVMRPYSQHHVTERYL